MSGIPVLPNLANVLICNFLAPNDFGAIEYFHNFVPLYGTFDEIQTIIFNQYCHLIPKLCIRHSRGITFQWENFSVQFNRDYVGYFGDEIKIFFPRLKKLFVVGTLGNAPHLEYWIRDRCPENCCIPMSFAISTSKLLGYDIAELVANYRGLNLESNCGYRMPNVRESWSVDRIFEIMRTFRKF